MNNTGNGSFNESNSLIKKPALIDLVIVLSFALLASICQINRVAGNSLFLFHSTDAANTASFIAAKDHPELFVGDEVLDDKRNFLFYSTIHVPVTGILARFTGDYASGFAYLLGFHVFLQALGFYIFGRVLFQSRPWAVFLALVTLVQVPLPLADFWGMHPDSLPRFSFQAVLPYLLAAIIYFRSKPAAWPWLFLAAGLFMYVHPVSAPAWGFAIWLGMLLLSPPSWGIWKRSGAMLALGLIFLAGASPFLINFMRNHVQGAPENYNTVLESIRYRYSQANFDQIFALRQYISNKIFACISLGGLAGSIYLLLYQKSERKKVLLIWMWIAGILIISIVVPFAEQLIARTYKTIPTGIELVRNLRYVFALMIVFCLWPLAVMTKNSVSKKRLIAVLVISLILVSVLYSHRIFARISLFCKVGVFAQRQDQDKSAETMDMLNAIKRLTPLRSRILSFSPSCELAIRYYATRPLVYSFKDGGLFTYSDHNKLIRWHQKAKAVEDVLSALKRERDDNAKMELLLDFSRRFNAQYLVIDRSEFSEPPVSFGPRIVYYNNLFVLIRTNSGNSG